MALAPEVQTWIDDLVKAGLSKEDLSGILTKAEQNEGIANALKGSVMAQSDYSRRMQQLATDQKAAKDELARTTAYAQSLAKWKQDEADPAVQRANQAVADAERRIASLQQAMSAQGLEPPAAPQPDAKPAPARDPETGKFITAEDFQKQARAFGRDMPLVNAKMLKLQQRHSKLYAGVKDAPEFDPEILVGKALETGKPLDDMAEELFSFKAREQAMHDADIQRRIDEGVKDGVSKRLSEMAVAGPTQAVRAPGHRVPFLDVGSRPAEKSTPQSPTQYQQAADTPARIHDRVSKYSDKLANELYGGNG